MDAYGYLTYGTFLSFMSGNTTVSASRLGQRNLAMAVPSLIAIVGFVSGATIGTSLTHARRRQARWVVFVLVAFLLSVAIIAGRLAPSTHLFQIATVSLAMGIMNSTVSRVGSESVSLTFVTGTLSRIGGHLALAWEHAPLTDAADARDTHARRAGQLTALWSAFLIGALLASVATPHLAVWTLVPPVAVLFAISALVGQLTTLR